MEQLPPGSLFCSTSLKTNSPGRTTGHQRSSALFSSCAFSGASGLRKFIKSHRRLYGPDQMLLERSGWSHRPKSFLFCGLIGQKAGISTRDANRLRARPTHDPYLDDGACARLTVGITIIAYAPSDVNMLRYDS